MMFTVRTILASERRVEATAFDLEPQLQQGRAVCNLFAEFLAGRPAEFREKLSFIAKGEIELEWAAATGGAAFAALLSDNQPVTMSILLSGADPDADSSMLEALRVSVLEPMFGLDCDDLLEVPERPAMLVVQLNEQPEMIPLAQLLGTALGSVYFRAVQAMAPGAAG